MLLVSTLLMSSSEMVATDATPTAASAVLQVAAENVLPSSFLSASMILSADLGSALFPARIVFVSCKAAKAVVGAKAAVVAMSAMAAVATALLLSGELSLIGALLGLAEHMASTSLTADCLPFSFKLVSGATLAFLVLAGAVAVLAVAALLVFAEHMFSSS